MKAVHELKNEGDVIVYQPDMRLREKLGRGLSLEKMFTIEIIEEAQKAVASMEAELTEKLLLEFGLLANAAQFIEPGEGQQMRLSRTGEIAFAIKCHAGFCNYPLVSALARALYLFCDLLNEGKISAREIEVVHCIVNGIRVVFEQKITGDGGAVGKAIAVEVQDMVLAAAKRWKKG